MEKALVFRFLSDRLPVLDVQYGQIVDGQFQSFDDVADNVCKDLPSLFMCCLATDVLGTQLVLKVKDFGMALYTLYRLEESIGITKVDMYPSFIVFHLKFYNHEQKEEIEEAR